MATKQQIKVFVIQSFRRGTEGVFELIASAGAKAGVQVTRSDMLMSLDKPIIETIQSAIEGAFLLIADLSDSNPNVMYEIGYAHSQNKPLILIAKNTRNILISLASEC